ncbi:MAG: hydroxymethylglutaryl-CoA lyase, partial [Planctomycetota bacterium]
MSPPLIANPPARARVVEVGPRDGLQNQAQRIPVETKRAWIERLSAAGIREIEVTSFVHPRWVPQLSDARELVRALGEAGSTLYSALVPNLRGLEDALAGGIHRIALFTAASETFNRRNINCGIEESLDRFRRIFDRLGREAGAGVHVRAYISTSFGCPYEGTVPPERVAEIAAELREMGAREIAVSDTTGVATPPQVEDVITTVAEAV